ncbi:MAG: 4-vinyl reductase [Nanoarchaeota archaeon]|nr:4-vinyl reductase [Nanoarchaeota archaeon]
MAKNEFIDKLQIHGNVFVDKDGCLNIIGLKGIMFPMVNYVLLYELLKENTDRKKVRDIFYYTGFMETFIAVKIIGDKYGFKDKRKILSLVLNQAQMIGIGKLELIKYEPQNSHFVLGNSQSPPGRETLKLLGKRKEAVDEICRGGIAGIFSSLFEKDMVAIETSCVVQGKSQCVHVVRERKVWAKTRLNAESKEQIPLSPRKYPLLNKFLEKENLLSRIF